MADGGAGANSWREERERQKKEIEEEVRRIEEERLRREAERQERFNSIYPPPPNVGYPVGGPNLEIGKKYYLRRGIPLNRARGLGLDMHWGVSSLPKHHILSRVKSKKKEKNYEGFNRVESWLNTAPSDLHRYAITTSTYFDEPWRSWGYREPRRHPEWMNRNEYYTVAGETYNATKPVHRPHIAAAKIQGTWRRKTAKRNIFNRAARPPRTLGPENTGGELYKLWERKFREAHPEVGSGVQVPLPSAFYEFTSPPKPSLHPGGGSTRKQRR